MKKEKTHDELYDAYMELCQQMYMRMERENSWPWVVDPEDWEKYEREMSRRNSDLSGECSNPSRGTH